MIVIEFEIIYLAQDLFMAIQMEEKIQIALILVFGG